MQVADSSCCKPPTMQWFNKDHVKMYVTYCASVGGMATRRHEWGSRSLEGWLFGGGAKEGDHLSWSLNVNCEIIGLTVIHSGRPQRLWDY